MIISLRLKSPGYLQIINIGLSNETTWTILSTWEDNPVKPNSFHTCPISPHTIDGLATILFSTVV